MFRTLGISKMYLNFNKQLISIRESENQTELSFLILCFTFPVHYSISLAVISKKVSYRARIIFTSDQEVMHVVHDTKFVVRVFLSGCYFHL